jgi:negative regulator of sigma E activity
MRDPVSTERISAYLDGELSDDERQLVERQLAESKEHSQLLEELEAVRADLRALPTFSAPPDLQARIAAQIEASKVAPVGEIPAAASQAERSQTRRWALAAAATLASIAAMVAIILLSRGPSVQPSDVVDPPILQTAPEHLEKMPQWTLLYDVSLTKGGQERKAFEKLLERWEIGLDPTMTMPGEVEDDLIALRQIGETDLTTGESRKADPTTPKSGENDNVELIYVSGTFSKLDGLGRELLRMRNAGDDVSEMRLDVVFEDRQLEVMRKLHDTALDHYVHSEPAGPSEEAYAFKLNFQIRFTSFGVPGAGSFAMPALAGKAKPDDLPAAGASLAGRRAASGASTTPTADKAINRNEPTDPDVRFGHVLIILRKAEAKAE